MTRSVKASMSHLTTALRDVPCQAMRLLPPRVRPQGLLQGVRDEGEGDRREVPALQVPNR